MSNKHQFLYILFFSLSLSIRFLIFLFTRTCHYWFKIFLFAYVPFMTCFLDFLLLLPSLYFCSCYSANQRSLEEIGRNYLLFLLLRILKHTYWNILLLVVLRLWNHLIFRFENPNFLWSYFRITFFNLPLFLLQCLQYFFCQKIFNFSLLFLSNFLIFCTPYMLSALFFYPHLSFFCVLS